MAEPRSTIAGSERSTPLGEEIGEISADTVAQVSVYLKVTQPPRRGGDFCSRAEVRAERQDSLKAQVSHLQTFAEQQGL